jgi:predicted NBD/HSP70 family sugar kinase
MAIPQPGVVVGLDVGGTTINATVLDGFGSFLVPGLQETPSCVLDGPDATIHALATALDVALDSTNLRRPAVRAVGLDTPGPASATGVISSKGATNFNQLEWHGYDIRGALAAELGIPVVYTNDANAASLYAHYVHFGSEAPLRSSVAAIVGTGLGGGVVEYGRVIQGAAGMAGELGHVHIPTVDLLEEDQPVPLCNCGFSGDAESFASLTGIKKSLLPYWLSRYPDHPLHKAESIKAAAKEVRGLAEAGDEMALKIFAQQAAALGRLFTIAANFTDPHAYFLGGGVVETAPHFREWFLDQVRTNTLLRDEQRQVATLELVPDRDMAGARGAAIAARDAFEAGQAELAVV